MLTADIRGHRAAAAAAAAPALQEQADLLAAGYEHDIVREAGEVSLEAVHSVLRKLPPCDWVGAQVRVTVTVTVEVL
mgnify:CR=1 FL=1